MLLNSSINCKAPNDELALDYHNKRIVPVSTRYSSSWFIDFFYPRLVLRIDEANISDYSDITNNELIRKRFKDELIRQGFKVNFKSISHHYLVTIDFTKAIQGLAFELLCTYSARKKELLYSLVSIIENLYEKEAKLSSTKLELIFLGNFSSFRVKQNRKYNIVSPEDNSLIQFSPKYDSDSSDWEIDPFRESISKFIIPSNRKSFMENMNMVNLVFNTEIKLELIKILKEKFVSVSDEIMKLDGDKTLTHKLILTWV